MSKQNEYLSDRELMIKQVELMEAILKILVKGQAMHHASLDLLDNSDMKRIFKASDSTLSRWRDEGLCFHQVNQKMYYVVSEVEAFLKRNSSSSMKVL
jgi:hypothetical protein